ncbi:MAG: hypothetical protein JOY81_06305, partial [Alphaproteobacteria bacterium]|nr:hypothetical protein [Alphaproteobacteria bacterium]
MRETKHGQSNTIPSVRPKSGGVSRTGEKLTVLLAEYNAMRSQVIARGSSIMQIASVGVASFAVAVTALSWVLTNKKDETVDGAFYVFGFIFVFLLGLVLIMVRFNHR